ncbi:hypothetical protein HDU82_007510 [Entophlyctis luteolus]|nr:hypothetical protein HDU82_007510 [Entophlyctis luteolus]
MFAAVLLPVPADPDAADAADSAGAPHVRLVCAPAAPADAHEPSPDNLHPAWPVRQPPRDETAQPPSPPSESSRILTLPLDRSLYVLQPCGCNSGQQSSFPKCRPCITKGGNGDTCRFKNLRVFKKKSKKLEYGPWFADASSLERISDEPVESSLEDLISLKSAQETESILLDIPERHKISTSTGNETYILHTTAPVLRSLIISELQIISSFPSEKTLLRPLLQGEKVPTYGRHLCDECSTSLWNSCFICIKCAREVCYDCYRDAIPASVDEMNSDAKFVFAANDYSCHFYGRKIPTPKLKRDKMKMKMPAYKCGMDMPVHFKDDFLLSLKISTGALKKMLAIVDVVLRTKTNTTASFPREELLDDSNLSHPAKLLKFDLQGDSENYLRLARDSVDAFEKFKTEWELGHAVVFEGGTGMIKADWSPSYFAEHHGDECANVVDCVTKESILMTVGDFFKFFLDPELERQQILKLPDWPPHSDFHSKFPDHYKDFLYNTPFPDYSGFTGCRNLAARLPVSYLPPDLGPKMYNAFGSSDAGDYGQGTTPIHLDMADAVNVMMYCSSFPADRPAAVWDIYALKDVPKLREYLNEYAERTGCAEKMEDCIHDQTFYLNEMMREELWKQKGVRAWRIYQNPGDAIFVPADGLRFCITRESHSVRSVDQRVSAVEQNSPASRRLAKPEKHSVERMEVLSVA